MPQRENLRWIPKNQNVFVLDHVGFRSGNFGRKGTFFSSQTKGNVVLDQDSLTSGKFGQTETFFDYTTIPRMMIADGVLFSKLLRIRRQKKFTNWQFSDFNYLFFF